MVQNLEGPQDAASLRSMLDPLTMSPMDRVRAQIDMLVAEGDRLQAIEMLQQVIAQEPQNFGLHAELCDLLIMENRADEARKILASLPADTEGIDKPRSRLEFIDLSADLPSLEELGTQLQDDPDNLQLCLHLAYRLVVDDQMEAALERLLMILKTDREWDDQRARTTMIKVFNLLGKGDELATGYRRKMFTFLH